MKTYLLLLFLSLSRTIKAQEHQIVNKNEFKINAKLSLFAKKKDFTSVIKKFDNIKSIDMEMECGFEEEIKKGVKFYTYKKDGLEYFVYNKNADFVHVDFKNYSNNFVTYKNNKISNQTTLDELKKIFPIAYNNYLSEIKNNKGQRMLILKFNKDWDDELRIYIAEGKVCAFSYWYPC